MDLNDFGVTELTETEMQDVDGGILPALAIGVVLLLWSTPAK
ncbi:MAG TPA: class IIb bacteriocin, lactobin A/cerein 7B family [Longimicrobiaceae bacterium]